MEGYTVKVIPSVMGSLGEKIGKNSKGNVVGEWNDNKESYVWTVDYCWNEVSFKVSWQPLAVNVLPSRAPPSV